MDYVSEKSVKRKEEVGGGEVQLKKEGGIISIWSMAASRLGKKRSEGGTRNLGTHKQMHRRK